MSDSLKILVVDDEINICELVRLYLKKDGYDVTCSHNGDDALRLFASQKFDAIILDIMLPGTDGVEVLKQIRKTSKVPVIMLTAKGETIDKVLGLELGADDYMVKPFEPKELTARLKAVLRRAAPEEIQSKSRVDFEKLSIDMDTYELKLDGEAIKVPPKELELLFYLCSHPGKVFTRDQLLDAVWDYEFYGDSRTVDVHIKRLREKIDKYKDLWEIVTVCRVGYKF